MSIKARSEKRTVLIGTNPDANSSRSKSDLSWSSPSDDMINEVQERNHRTFRLRKRDISASTPGQLHRVEKQKNATTKVVVHQLCSPQHKCFVNNFLSLEINNFSSALVKISSFILYTPSTLFLLTLSRNLFFTIVGEFFFLM